jgi:hypothetical protein
VREIAVGSINAGSEHRNRFSMVGTPDFVAGSVLQLLKSAARLAISPFLRHKGAIAGTERLDGSDAAFGHKADACHLRGSRIGFM